MTPVDAIVMAGGRSRRMRAGSSTRHKALREAGGETLAARAVRMLIEAGMRSIAISVSAGEPELCVFAQGSLRRQAESAGVAFDCLVETAPLGTIGAVRSLRAVDTALLVVNVDNVTQLDVTGLIAAHRTNRYDMTIATHVESFTMPFGELVLHDHRVERYVEKPSVQFVVSSGTYVLGPAAISAIAPNEPIDVPALFARLRLRGGVVGTYEHHALWIDVNDDDALRRADTALRSVG